MYCLYQEALYDFSIKNTIYRYTNTILDKVSQTQKFSYCHEALKITCTSVHNVSTTVKETSSDTALMCLYRYFIEF